MCAELVQSQIKVLIQGRFAQRRMQRDAHWGEGERTGISQTESVRKSSHCFPRAAQSDKLLLGLFSNYAVLIHIIPLHFLPTMCLRDPNWRPAWYWQFGLGPPEKMWFSSPDTGWRCTEGVQSSAVNGRDVPRLKLLKSLFTESNMISGRSSTLFPVIETATWNDTLGKYLRYWVI